MDARLSVLDSLLSDVIVQITAAQTLAAGARGSTVTNTQLDALATQLEGIRDTLLADVNTQMHGVYLFGGSSIDNPTLREDGRGSCRHTKVMERTCSSMSGATRRSRCR